MRARRYPIRSGLRPVCIALVTLMGCGESSPYGYVYQTCTVPESFPADGVVLELPGDLEALAEETALAGLFACEIPGLERIDLPKLRSIGTLILTNNEALRVIHMPALEIVDRLSIQSTNLDGTQPFQEREAETRLTELNLTKLATATSFDISGATELRVVELPALASVEHTFSLFRMSAERVELPRLASASRLSISGVNATALHLPALTRLETLDVENNRSLRTLELRGVQQLGYLKLTDNPVLETVALTSLRELRGREADTRSFSLRTSRTTRFEPIPIEHIDGSVDIRVGSHTDLAWLPNLRSVSGDLDASIDGPQEWPTLEHVGRQIRTRTGRGPTKFPALKTVGGQIGLEYIVAPALEEVGSFRFEGGNFWAKFPALERVHGDLDLLALEKSDTATSFPNLVEVGGAVRVEDAQLLAVVRFPRLADVAAELVIKSNTSTAIEMPALRTVGEAVIVFDNPLLRQLDLPNLEAVGGDLVIANNPALSVCQATDLAMSIDASIGGEVATTGNLEVSTCE